MERLSRARHAFRSERASLPKACSLFATTRHPSVAAVTHGSTMSRLLALLRTALFSLSVCTVSLSAQATTYVINIDATSATPTAQILGNGGWLLTLANGAPGALYTAWNPWGSTVSGCDGAGLNCTQGWSNAFTFGATGLPDQYALVPAAEYASTAAGSLSAALLGPITVSIPLIGPILQGTYPLLLELSGGPLEMLFWVDDPDSNWSDNAGGVSLLLTFIPVPSTALLALAGAIGLLGGVPAARARRRG
jgi:hypothetical protein